MRRGRAHISRTSQAVATVPATHPSSPPFTTLLDNPKTRCAHLTMVDWISPEEIQRDAAAFLLTVHVLIGIYVWEWFISLDFDWQYISGKKKICWPIVPYFLNRYCMLFALVGTAVALNATKEIHCQALYTFNQCVGNAAIGLSCINLSLRTIAVWSRNKYLIAFLVLVVLGHWSFLIRAMVLKAEWVSGTGCVIVAASKTPLLYAGYIYSMALDFVILCLTTYKLIPARYGYSRLVELIIHDGLIYFLIAFLANLTATIFMFLSLNPVMTIIANIPAAITSTIVACRVVRRLSRFLSQDVQVFGEDVGRPTRVLSLQIPSFHPKVSTKHQEARLRVEMIETPSDGEPPSVPHRTTGEIAEATTAVTNPTTGGKRDMTCV